MNDWELVTQLLAEATERPPTERHQWIRASGLPESITQEALRLLAAWEDDPDFLEVSSPPPPNLGPWRIGREIGSGGMGRVYEAFHADPTIERRVALKVIGGRRFSPGLIDSFLRERAILARLEHPSIARLYDTGTTPQGLPYFAMEFVDGQPIDVYTQSRQLSTRDRVTLLRAVAKAVAFAHQNLIVHGDLKPSNILVTPQGEPRLLDFGVGRTLQSDPAETDDFTKMLTPAHASPEQWEGRPLTPASDVFQLGLLLKSVLAGTPGESNRELTEIIRKCLATEPLARYPTADALQDDLRRWLDHAPVTAVPPSWTYRTSKLLRRHPLWAAVAATLVLGALTTAWQARRAIQNERRALHQSEETRKFSRQLLDKMTGLPVTMRKQVVETSVELLRSLEQPGERDPVVLLDLAHAWASLGKVQGLPTAPNLGQSVAAAESYAHAIALAERAQPGNPKAAWRALTIYYAEAGRVAVRNHDNQAVGAYAQKLSGAIQALEPFGISSRLATATSELAYLRSLTDRKAAMDLYRNAITQFDAAPDPDLPQKAFALKRLGGLLLSDKQILEAVTRYEAALAIERQIKADPFSISFTLSDLGLAQRLQKRFPAAIALYREALAIREEALKADPSNMRAIDGVASTLRYLAWAHFDAGQPAEAAALARRALEFRRRSAAPPSGDAFARSRLAWAQLDLATFLRKQNPKGSTAEIAPLILAIKQSLQKETDKELSNALTAFETSANE